MKHILTLSVFIFLIVGQAIAQVTITGQVKDKAGEPLPGVTVAVQKGSTTLTGTITDINGKYSVANVPADAVIVFSFIGMTPQKIDIGNKSVIDIVLLEANNDLDEVVIVGYGSQKRAHITGSVTSIQGSALQDIPAMNLSTALEGRLSGVWISQATGKPGSNTSLRIREVTSYKEEEKALYVIDGVIRDQESFDLLDPSEVESISILKDASAAVYGVKSSAGVVLVKTKRGAAGKTNVNFSSSYGISEAINTTAMLSAYDHAKMLNDYYDETGETSNKFSDNDLAYIRDSLPNGGYDWLKSRWRNATLRRHTLTISGGSEKIRYSINGSYQKETGFFEKLDVSKKSVRGNFDVDLTKTLTAQFSASIANRIDNSPVSTNEKRNELMKNTFQALLQNPKWVPPYLNGYALNYNYNTSSEFNNPNAMFDSPYYDRNTSDNSNFTAALEYKPGFIKGLSLKAQVNYNNTVGIGKIYLGPIYVYSTADNQRIIKPYYTVDENNRTVLSGSQYIQESSTKSNKYQYNYSINYNRKFGEHDVSALAVCEINEENTRRVGLKREGAQLVPGSDELWAYAEGADKALTSDPREYGSIGFIGRINYNYGLKYLAEFSFREDASTKFAPKYRWGFFPSLLIGWVASEENFFKSNLKFINFLKLRLSSGLMGLDNVRDFLWMYSYGTAEGVLFGSTPTSGIEAKNAAIINEMVSWQKTIMNNAGLDMKFLDNKLSFSFDAFYKYSYDILDALSSTNPTTVGISSSNIRFNYGKMHAWGGEIELGYKGKLPFNIEYNIKGNFGYAEAMILKVAQSPAAVGQWYDRLKNSIDNQPGLISTGIIRTQEELDDMLMDNPNYTILDQKPELGLLNYKDLRGADFSDGPNGVLSSGTGVPYEDNTTIARKTSPPCIYGFTLGFSWKGFKIETTLHGKFGHQVFFDKEAMKTPTVYTNVPSFWKDHYTEENPNAAYPRASSTQYKDIPVSTFWMRNGHTLRITDLNASYTLPQSWSRAIKLNQLRIFFDSKYLWTIINPLKYKDVNLSDYCTYPMLRTYNFGLNISF